MDLSDFVKVSLLGIANGVTEANHACGGDAPFAIGGELAGVVEFDVLVGVSDEESSAAKGEVAASLWKALKISASGEVADKAKRDNQQRIKFKVRILERSEIAIETENKDG